MALSAAMVLSGLPKEQFTGNLQHIFNRGAVLLTLPPPPKIRTKLTVFEPPKKDPESGSTSTAATAEKILGYYLEVIAKLEERFQIFTERKQESPKEKTILLCNNRVPLDTDENTERKVESPEAKVILQCNNRDPFHLDENTEKEVEPSEEKLILLYNDRNLLDLGENVKTNWLFQTAVLKQGVSNFLENRAQFSRLDGTALPRHVVSTCDEDDCNFCENIYF